MFRLHSVDIGSALLLTALFGSMMLRLASGFSSSSSSWRWAINSYSTHQLNHHRGGLSTSLFYFSTKVPHVEVSPSDHGTHPLSDNFMSSSSMMIDKRLIKTLQSSAMNITKPTPIQSHAMPLLFNNYDVMASSATGSGKTLMFGLPLLNQLLSSTNNNTSSRTAKNSNIGQPTALIISPTRELAVQTAEVLNTFTKMDTSLRSQINVCLATGGSDSRNQRNQLSGCNILVGTPGRICQFIDERNLSLQYLNYLVIDEADRLLDMGFEKDLTRISRSFSRSSTKQSILCSATFPQGVQRLAADFLNPNYYFVSAGKVGSTHSSITQQFEWVDMYDRGGRNNNRNSSNNRNNINPKVEVVLRNVEKFWSSNPRKDQASVLVFSNTKEGAELYGKALSNKFGNDRNRVVRVIHGDK